jgi:hypothetical protein
MKFSLNIAIGLGFIGAAALAFMTSPAYASVVGNREVNGGTRPRSVRNNNPGNIVHGETWQGETIGDDPVFETFQNEDFGARAMLMNMRTHHARGHNTIASMIGGWTATDVTSYTLRVSQIAGHGPSVAMLWNNPKWSEVAYAMAIVEAGGEYFPKALFYKWWVSSLNGATPSTGGQRVLNPKTSGAN